MIACSLIEKKNNLTAFCLKVSNECFKISPFWNATPTYEVGNSKFSDCRLAFFINEGMLNHLWGFGLMAVIAPKYHHFGAETSALRTPMNAEEELRGSKGNSLFTWWLGEFAYLRVCLPQFPSP